MEGGGREEFREEASAKIARGRKVCKFTRRMFHFKRRRKRAKQQDHSDWTNEIDLIDRTCSKINICYHLK
jgi:hypothetical protein